MKQTHSNKKHPNKERRKSKILGDRFFIFIFVLFDIGLLILAKNNFESLNDLATRSLASIPTEQEQSDIKDLEKIAASGSWEDFERARSEQAAHYLQSNLRPTAGDSLYFYPETLSQQSFEREFATQQLQPGIRDLKKAYLNRKAKEASRAYMRLKTRVQNYELGVSSNDEDLSDEAKKFLNLYNEFTKLNGMSPIEKSNHYPR